ncbi:hypothetical protein BaRGS_00016208 [Batillaria attramentaria]|uniref:UBA domain-containing protein n=1 Tax=Batillaria attramentaria TaxID=370345 RepID=A0ABD0KZ97_9CAEN
MAYDRHPNQPQSQNSVMCLASSISCLDGVPFKIGTAFRPPARAILPPELLRRPQPCDALNDEYSYETEEAVLAWARAREEAKLKAAAEREAAEKARAALAAAESNSSDSEEDVPDEPADQQPMASASGEASSKQQAQTQPMRPPWQLQLAAPESNAILTPMPIQTQAKKKLQSPAGAPKVDLAMFEQEGDPFDNLELQSINDMEELRTVLDGSHSTENNRETSPKSDGQASERDNAGDASQSRVAAETSNTGNYVPWTLMSQETSIDPPQETSVDGVTVERKNDVSGGSENVDGNAAPPSQGNSRFVFDTACDGEYVQIRSDYTKQAVSFQRDCAAVPSAGPSGVSNAGTTNFGGELPTQYASSKLFKPVLPPIVRPRSESLGVSQFTSNVNTGMQNKPFTSADTSTIYQNSSSYSNVPAAMSQSAYVLSSSPSNMYDMSKSDFSVPINHYSNLPATSMGFRPVSMGQSQGGLGGPWNPYKPLPPTPHSHSPDMRSASSSSGSPSPDLRRSPGPHLPTTSTAMPASPELDPYNSLSHEAKAFVNNLTSMGFSRSRAARAVLDHLLNVDKLVEKKFKPELAETGLQLFRNDIKKAEQFLDLYQQFQELGFTGERIQTALVKHQLDRDKALDYLTT